MLNKELIEQITKLTKNDNDLYQKVTRKIDKNNRIVLTKEMVEHMIDKEVYISLYKDKIVIERKK